jgi:glycolate oxidase FAD binding subunit
MTITVEAGITIGALRDVLQKEKLRLPIDVPQSDRATLGGAIAANVSGARRYGYGTLRDYVIGIAACNDEGNEFKAGGRVVKNVAGYDLCKLLVGSLGTLGIITKVTLKLRPGAEQQAMLTLAVNADQIESLLTAVHETRTRPVCVELMRAKPPAGWSMLIGYEGNADAVSWQVQQLVKEIGGQCPLEAHVDFPTNRLWHALTELSALPEWQTVFKVSLPASRVAEFCLHAERDASAIRAHAGNGIVHGHWGADLTNERAASILNVWRELVAPFNGSVIVTRCPSEWKKSLSVWGPPTADLWLMRDVKAKIDPRGLFNPGRFVGGI